MNYALSLPYAEAPPRAVLAALPKIDLHRHLEGSLRLSTLAEFASQHDLDVPARDSEALRPHVQITKAGGDFTEFLSKFPVLRKFYHSEAAIARLAYEAVEDAAADNVRYLELRFNPVALAQARDYPLAEVTDWVIAAVREAETACNIRVNLLVTVNRREIEQAEQLLQVMLARAGAGIVGIDLAGDEANFPALPFAGSFEAARQAGLHVTVHAGEWSGPENIRYAIEQLHAERIGHGVHVVEDASVARLARERDVAFEVCVTSNVQSGVVETARDHPLPQLRALQVITTINTDDPAVSGITLTDEYELVCSELGVSLSDLQAMILTAAEHAFLPAAERAALVAAVQHELRQNSN